MFSCFCQQDSQINVNRGWLEDTCKMSLPLPFSKLQFALSWITPRNDVVVPNNGDFYSARSPLSPGSRRFQKVVDQARRGCFISLTVTVPANQYHCVASGRHPLRSRTNVRPATSG
nr:hypothetical protein [uncultured bacterium]